jgi:hypothetical protein
MLVVMQVATARWRAATRPESLSCTACARNVHSHYMHVVGHDAVGRPVIFSNHQVKK